MASVSCPKKIIIATISILGISSGLFAQDTGSDQAYAPANNAPEIKKTKSVLREERSNQGYVSANNAPEIKKEKFVLQEKRSAPEKDDKKISSFQNQARVYRKQGIELQRAGRPEDAMVCYQKAIVVDPAYVIPYNDLGVLYEAKGLTDKAEENYLQAIKISPGYLSPYSNLALLYEGKRDLVMAAFYWGKRATLGSPLDPWTAKARERFEDIKLVLGDKGLDPREQEILAFMDETLSRKSALRAEESRKLIGKSYPEVKSDPDLQRARYLFHEAKLDYEAGYYEGALKKAVDASLLDPSNGKITEFIDKLQTLLLLK